MATRDPERVQCLAEGLVLSDLCQVREDWMQDKLVQCLAEGLVLSDLGKLAVLDGDPGGAMPG